MSTKFGENDTTGQAVSATVGILNPPTDMWDRSHPKSFMSLVPQKWAEMFEQARFERGELFEMDERELYQCLRKENKTPNATLNTLRLRLWLEYERCQQKDGCRIEIFRVLGDVCRTNHFEKTVLARPERAAWLLCPPTSYKMKVEEALNFGLDKLREILDLDVVEDKVDKSGKTRRMVNVKLGELQAKIVNMLDVRVNGAARQRIEQVGKTLNYNIDVDARDVGRAMEGVTEADLDEQIRQLEYRERQALNLPPMVPEKNDEVIDGEYSMVAYTGNTSDSNGVIDT